MKKQILIIHGGNAFEKYDEYISYLQNRPVSLDKFRTKDWKQGWDGKIDGVPQPTSVFVWFLRYTNRDTKKEVQQKGTVTLIR